MKALRDFVSALKPRNRIYAVVGMCCDKDVRDVLAILGETASAFVLTQVDNPRAMEAAKLEALSPPNVETIVIEDSIEALKYAVTTAGNDGLVLATGSLYLVGEVLRYYGLGELD
jgi:dihydrofolate synthase/folylpolyglutamate synthase